MIGRLRRRRLRLADLERRQDALEENVNALVGELVESLKAELTRHGLKHVAWGEELVRQVQEALKGGPR